MAIVDALHRSVWQGLPYRWRRAALLNVAAIVAPRPSAGARAAAPIVVAGVLRTSSGLGQSARLCHDALKDTGATVYGVDLAATFRQPLDYREFEFADGRRLEGAGHRHPARQCTVRAARHASARPPASFATSASSHIGRGNCRGFRWNGGTAFRLCMISGCRATSPPKRCVPSRRTTALR